MSLLKFYFSANSPTISAQTCNDLFPAALKNLQVLDEEALEKPQILDTEAIRGYVVTDPVVLSAMEKFPSYQDWFLACNSHKNAIWKSKYRTMLL